nr:MAG TPA: hypothetical protein [Bacteriophage sp.]
MQRTVCAVNLYSLYILLTELVSVASLLCSELIEV